MSKRALVTGASGGIGEVFARELAGQGYAVTLVARSEDKLKAVAASLEGSGHQTVPADLSTLVDVQRLEAEVRANHYDLVINNAGAGIYGDFAEIGLDDQMRIQHLNCDALVRLSHAYLQTARSGDALINVASVLGLLAFPQGALYAATKAYVINLSQSLWLEQKPKGVYVMGFCPGATKTNFFNAAGGDPRETPPDAIMETPEQVVRCALRALKKRRQPVVVSGGMNRLLVALTRLLSRKQITQIMHTFAPKTAGDA